MRLHMLTDYQHTYLLGGTYAGNPLACEAALKVIEIIEKEQLNEKAETLGHNIEQFLQELTHTYDSIGQ